MKTLSIISLVMVAFFLSSVATLGQTDPQVKYLKEKIFILNLEEGIKSENLGLRRSAIFFAGKYKLAGLNKALIAALKQEQDPSTKILISLSLFNIGEVEGMDAILNLSFEEKDQKAKRMMTRIYHEYQKSLIAQNQF